MEINELIEELSKLGRRKTDPLIIESVLYYFGSILLNRYRHRKTIGNKNFIRYYSLIFAPSGVGKSYIVNKIKDFADLKDYAEKMKNNYIHNIKLLNDEIDQDEYKDILKYMPKDVLIGIEGTAEGLFKVANSQNASGYGSLNLFTDEFGDAMNSIQLIDKLKNLYDGNFSSKIIKGNNDSIVNSNIDNIIVNFLALTSKANFNNQTMSDLKKLINSGLYRRSFIIESNNRIEKNSNDCDIDKVKKYFNKLNRTNREKLIKLLEKDIFSEIYFKYSDEYLEYIDEIDDFLVKRANDNLLNEFFQFDTGSLEAIIDLSHIICFLELKDKLEKKHIEKSFNFFLKTRETVMNTFKTSKPYERMFKILLHKDNLTLSEMAELDDVIPTSKAKIKDNISLLEELCYRKNKILTKIEGKVIRYSIKDLEKNNLNKIIISYYDGDKGEYAINYTPSEIKWEKMKDLVVSKNIKSFTTCHYMPSDKAPNGHRRESSFIEGENMIVLDIDDGMTIEEAKEKLSDITYIIYTTQSHRKNKHGTICDRFRIVIPTLTIFYVNPQQHKELYRNIENLLEISSNDPQTRNVSRAWRTNPDGIVYENTGILLDISPCIPNTEKSEKYIPLINEYENQNLDKRAIGFYKWFIMNTSSGNRFNNLTKAAYFFKEIGFDWKQEVIKLNNLLQEPMDYKELERTILCIK